MLSKVRSVLEHLLAHLALERRRLVLLHVIVQQLSLLEDLMAVEASVDDTVEVDEAVDAQFFLHLEAERAVGTSEVSGVDLLVSVDEFLVGISRRVAGKESRAICLGKKKEKDGS